PQDIDDEILKQTNTRIYLGLQPEVVERIRIPADYEDQIVTFDKGQAVVDAPDVRPVEVQGLDVCVTDHSN
ncbi:MAG: ATP-binding protein, partial [Halobacteriaceae archaeon]